MVVRKDRAVLWLFCLGWPRLSRPPDTHNSPGPTEKLLHLEHQTLDLKFYSLLSPTPDPDNNKGSVL
jgi:hypothetical protein